VTGEAVEVELRPARLGSRAAAYLLDLAVQLGLFIALAIAAAVTNFQIDDDLARALGIVLLLLWALGYPVILETLWHGRTVGKAALGLRVVRDDGGPAPFTAILIREAIGAVLEKPGLSFGLVGIVTMVGSERAKRVGDMAAGTIVVTDRVAGRRAPELVMPPPLAGWAAAIDLSRVPDPLALHIRQFLGRADQLDRGAEERFGNELVGRLAQLTAPPPPGTPGWAYLTAVVVERRRRALAGILPSPGSPSGYGPQPPAGSRPAPPPPPFPPASSGGFTAPM
jgi:uncharacterized RDD family membrane protein YckC